MWGLKNTTDLSKQHPQQVLAWSWRYLLFSVFCLFVPGLLGRPDISEKLSIVQGYIVRREIRRN
jgi:hypothetical protein